MQELTLTINHPAGLHLRPANMLFQALQGFESKVLITNLDRPRSPEIDARGSMFDIISIGVSQGHRVRVRTVGADAPETLAAIVALVNSNFGEG